MSPASKIRIATRGSLLARWQAEWVAERLRQRNTEPIIVEVSTEGDRRDAQQIANLGSQGVFTKEIQQAVLAGRADIAVHSFKDLPTEPTPGMIVAAVPMRADPTDALVTAVADSLADLAAGARVGTSSVRRKAQLLRARSDLHLIDIRGNVDTRLAKLDRGEFDAVVLAVAGLTRLGYEDRITQRFDPELMLPAPGQGALAIECRADDDETRALLAPLEDPPSRLATDVERELLSWLRAGCLAPVGALAQCRPDDTLVLRAAVLSTDGRSRLAFAGEAPAAEGRQLAARAAEKLLADGADRLIAVVHSA